MVVSWGQHCILLRVSSLFLWLSLYQDLSSLRLHTPLLLWRLVLVVHTLWNTRVLDDDVRHVCDTCFDKGKTESCLVKAPAMRASESVLVVSELLCTGVQANTERHTKERNAQNVLMLGIQTTLLLTQFERVA